MASATNEDAQSATNNKNASASTSSTSMPTSCNNGKTFHDILRENGFGYVIDACTPDVYENNGRFIPDRLATKLNITRTELTTLLAKMGQLIKANQ